MRLAEAVGLAHATNNMSPASPRKSSESVRSGTSTPSISHYSLSQLESPREPPRKYALRRGSTASSIVTIGSILDSSFQHGTIAESGNNGNRLVVRCLRELMSLTGRCIFKSHFNPSPKSYCPYGIGPSQRHCIDRIQDPYVARHSASNVDKYSTGGI